MERDQGLRQRQTEPYTFMPPAQRTVDLLETGQRLWDIFHGDPDTGIYNLQHEAAIGLVPGPDRNRAAGFGELDRVRQQVDENLLEPTRVGAQVRDRTIENVRHQRKRSRAT